MKTIVTCMNCEISIEEVDGKCVVVATQDGEVVEEFTLDCEASDEVEDVDVEDVDMDDMEEEGDEDMDDMDDMDELPEEDDDLNEGVKTFTKFFEKKRKK